jgi:hypothetical protein
MSERDANERDADGEPLPNPDYWRESVYAVRIYLAPEPLPDGGATPTLSAGAASDADLATLLRRIALTYCADAGQQVTVQIWDNVKGEWHHPAGKTMPDGWDGLLTVEVGVHVGSANL